MIIRMEMKMEKEAALDVSPMEASEIVRPLIRKMSADLLAVQEILQQEDLDIKSTGIASEKIQNEVKEDLENVIRMIRGIDKTEGVLRAEDPEIAEKLIAKYLNK